jgi:hypothetical protein
MPLRALLLVLAATVMHTGWNFLVKRAKDKQFFYLVGHDRRITHVSPAARPV